MMINYLYELVTLLNNYNDGNKEAETRIRDLVCFISDDPQIMQNNLYRSIIFEAAQKMRMFGYIKGINKIEQNEFVYDNLSEIKHSTIQNYYKSNVYSNNWLDKRQKEVIDKFMSLPQRRLLVSAPTSFGKTFLLREILFLNREKYKNILLVFPTIALLNENTDSVNQLIQAAKLEHKVVKNVYSGINVEEKHIFILTPERVLKLLADNINLHIDFFFFDEVYKIDEDFSRNEDSGENDNDNKNEIDSGNRAKAFRVVLYLLAKNVSEYYLAGPYLNLEKVKKGMRTFLEKNNITTIQVDFEPTSRIEIEAWKKNSVEHHPIYGAREAFLYNYNSSLTTKGKIKGLIEYLRKNRFGQAIFYCATPSKSMEYTKDIITVFSDERDTRVPIEFIEHLRNKYNVKIENNQDSSSFWSLIQALESGIGIHHGKFPKYIQNEILRLFNDGLIEYLFCTSTIIEGVNTNAKNVVIINNSVGNRLMTAFALKNIKGRAGRYYHHSMGRVFYTDSKQRNIENESEMELNFKIYDDLAISNVDIDNAQIADLAERNREIKEIRETKFDKKLLPDSVFVKNRLYARDVQENYLKYIMQNHVFMKFRGTIENTSNISYFLTNNVVNTILETFVDVGILGEKKANVYYAVISSYSKSGTVGILKYHVDQISRKNMSPEEKMDAAYIETFKQIRNIVEYEVPKLLCLFEAIFQQAGTLLGYNMVDFNLSTIIRFFELGITTELGLFLVEYGFPTDTIRKLERKCPEIGKMEAVDAARYLSEKTSILSDVMDLYEIELYKKSISVLMKSN